MHIRHRAAGIAAAALLVAAGVGAGTAPAQAAAPACTRYVATTGSDSNAGTSTSAPWKTIQKAANSATPGAVVCVRSGTYAEKVVVNVSGTAGNVILFRNYDNETPVVDGTGLSLSGRTGGFSLTNRAYVTIQGFEIRNFKTTSTSVFPAGIWVQGSGDHVEIRNNKVHDIKGECKGDCGAHGIAVYGTSSTANTNTIVDGNEVYNNQLGWSESVVFNGNVQNFTATNNTIHDNDNIGIDAIGYEGECSGCGDNDRARDGLIQNNLVYGIDSSKNTPYNGDRSADGIYVDGGTRITIERNTVHHSDIGIEIASEHQGKSTSAVTVRSNLLHQNLQVGIAFGGYDTGRGSTTGSSIVNNTLWNNATQGDWGAELYIQVDTTGNTVKDNIVYAGTGKKYLESTSTAMSGNVIDRNLWFAPGGGTSGSWIWKGTTYSTFAAYRSASGNDATSLIGTDPALVSTSTTAPNLHILSTSPAKNAGVAVSSTGALDIDSQTRTQGSAIDIGADEVG